MGLPEVRFHDLRHPDVKQATKNNEHFNRISWSQENRYTIADNFILRFYQRKHPGGWFRFLSGYHEKHELC